MGTPTEIRNIEPELQIIRSISTHEIIEKSSPLMAYLDE